MSVRLPDDVHDVISHAYEEDLGGVGDVTSIATIPSDHRSCASFVARAAGCIAGLRVVQMCLAHVDPSITTELHVCEGDSVAPHTVVLTATGPTRSLLTAERVALNLLGQLSGVASATRAFVEAVAGTGVAISDTRKTTPGLRSLEKYAVAVAGGVNHRMGLFDAVLIKDNHLAASDSIPDAVDQARSFVGSDMSIEVEVDTLDQLAEVMNTSADAVLLDNMTAAELTEAVALVDGVKRTEASGGVTLETVRAIAETGIDVISVGWLTHSAPALDVAMDLTAID